MPMRLDGAVEGRGVETVRMCKSDMETERNTGAYSALIRTFNSSRTLPATLDSLHTQTEPPARIVFVDSGSTDATLEQIPPVCTVHRYTGSSFNYSSALNQGLQHVDTEYVLIISSHTILGNPNAVSYALDLLKSNPLFGAVYFDFTVGPLDYTAVDKRSFDGFNGLWNTCALIRVELLRLRPFNEEIPAAEDQEWAAWLIRRKSLMTARISGGGMNNPFSSPPRTPSHVMKVIREQAAVVYFIRGDSPVRMLSAAVTPGGPHSWRHRALQIIVALRIAWLQQSL